MISENPCFILVAFTWLTNNWCSSSYQFIHWLFLIIFPWLSSPRHLLTVSSLPQLYFFIYLPLFIFPQSSSPKHLPIVIFHQVFPLSYLPSSILPQLYSLSYLPLFIFPLSYSLNYLPSVIFRAKPVQSPCKARGCSTNTIVIKSEWSYSAAIIVRYIAKSLTMGYVAQVKGNSKS